jgi:thiosulfate/3-mercaptopyruvate sulfurtransferase
MNSVTVSADWLAAHLAEVVVVDCRFALMEPQLGRQQYEAGHIPGAHYLDLNQDLSAPVGEHGGRHPLPDVAAFAAKLSQLGVTNTTLVVAYDDSRFAFAARLWWLLRYLGHDQVAVLDGGWKAWIAKDYPITTDLPVAEPTLFIPQPRSHWLVDINSVKSRKDSTLLIDSREPERYRGDREPIDPVAGHIPGAMNYPWQDITDAAGFVRPDLKAYWDSLQPAEEVIVYCGSGVTACVNLLGLAIAGIESKLYAGSWSDWCSYL